MCFTGFFFFFHASEKVINTFRSETNTERRCTGVGAEGEENLEKKKEQKIKLEDIPKKRENIRTKLTTKRRTLHNIIYI